MTGHKKVKNFFVDLKIPLPYEKKPSALCHESDIIWVCGLRIDERFKVHPETKRMVRVTLDFADGPLADFFLNHPSKQS
jgi:tRNA(Ile)-lysidine synthase